MNCLHLWYTYYQRKVSVKELHRILVKVVDTYELQEFAAFSALYNTVMAEGGTDCLKCAEWYCRKEPEEEHFYEILFRLCQKYNVRWASATPKEKAFIEEVTRVTYERDKAQRLGLPLSEVRPSFAS